MTRWGVSPTTVGRLAACGAPWSLLLMIQYIVSLRGVIVRDLDCVEMFSGEGELSTQFQVQGLTSQKYDIVDNMLTGDFTSDLGFLNSLWLVETFTLQHVLADCTSDARCALHASACKS